MEVAAEIDELKRRLARAEALLETELSYRKLFETMEEGFAVGELVRNQIGHAIDFRYLELNRVVERLTGWNPRETVGRLLSEMISSEETAYWVENFEGVATSGSSSQSERFDESLGRWFRVNASAVGEDRIALVYQDVSARKRGELSLRESEERQAFLLKLSDAVHPLADAVAEQTEGLKLLVEHLGLARASFCEVDPDQDGMTLTASAGAEAGPWSTRLTMSDFGPDISRTLQAGRIYAVGDSDTDPSLSDEGRTAIRSLGIRRLAGVPLIRAGRLLMVLCVYARDPRDWRGDELRLLGEAADRIWAFAERARAEAALRESEERQAFLLTFSDALRAEPEADAIAARAVRMLGEQLGLDLCYTATFHPDEDRADLGPQFRRGDAPPLPETLRLSDLPDALRPVLERTLVFDDLVQAPELSETERRTVAALGLGAMISVSARRGTMGPSSWSITAISRTPRRWTASEIALIEEASERIWAAVRHARYEAALRESEERFQQFASASAAGLWIRNARMLEMEFASAAIATIYGVEPGGMLADVDGWAAMIVPEDRDIALRHLDQARDGNSVVHEFRIRRPSDGAFRWIRNTDFPLRDNGDIPRIGGITEDVTEAKLAVEHQVVLLAELQHRVRNIIAQIRAITAQTAASAASVAEHSALMGGRLSTFARVQALLTRGANVGVDVATIVQDEIGAQCRDEGQYALSGPRITLSPKATEVLTLALHELTTNALKYGALSAPDGRITVEWATFQKHGAPWLRLDWTEEGAPAGPQPAPDRPRRRGFGTELIEERIPYELGGEGKVTIEPGGARCRLEFPLKGGASILATDAPKRTTVFGGALDMAGEADLSGHCILVLEDDYFAARDTARAVSGAGAEVLGPFPTEEAAQAALRERRPSAAVLDINLGEGASFRIARALQAADVPFVFVTGYDQEVVPAEYARRPRLQKPVDLRQIVDALAGVIGTAR